MQKRRFGRIGYWTSIVALGSLAVGWRSLSPGEIDSTVRLALDHGVNYFDVAPSYEDAEVHLSHWIREYRDSIFVAEKTMAREGKGAWEELQSSLKRTGAEYFDLYQLHAVNTMEDLNKALGPGGAVEAFEEAKKQGLIKHIGITGHADMTVLAEAIRRYPFESVLLPVNFIMYHKPTSKSDFRPVLNMALEKDMGVIAIKVIAKQRWTKEPHSYRPWYEPFDDPEVIRMAFDFSLSQPGVSAYATASDHRLVPSIIEAAESYEPISAEEWMTLRQMAERIQPIFPEPT